MQYRSVCFVVAGLITFPAWAGSPDTIGVPNFHQVDERVYRGGKLIVDLRTAGEHPIQTEARAVEAAGMTYLNVPMSTLGAPSAEAVFKILALIESDSTGPVFVHCKRGSDRTGTVIACYRILHDHWDNRKALQEARSYGMYRFERAMMHYILKFDPAAPPLAPGIPTADLPGDR